MLFVMSQKRARLSVSTMWKCFWREPNWCRRMLLFFQCVKRWPMMACMFRGLRSHYNFPLWLFPTLDPFKFSKWYSSPGSKAMWKYGFDYRSVHVNECGSFQSIELSNGIGRSHKMPHRTANIRLSKTNETSANRF